jgi:regulator of protease activity HflC (stomatin/prohibitin superfamily)
VVVAAQHRSSWWWPPVVLGVLVLTSLVIVPPGQTSVVRFFGRYVGTVDRPGFWWVLPLTVRRRINAQVEMLLRRALADAGRMPRHAQPVRRPGRPPSTT